MDAITKMSQVTPEVTLFLRKLGLSNYYILKIFDLVRDAAIAIIEDNPYWLLEEFPRLGFEKVDHAADLLGIAKNDSRRVQAVVIYCLRKYIGEGHAYAPLEELCLMTGGMLELNSDFVREVLEDMAFEGELQLTNLNGVSVVYFYGHYRAECMVAGKLAELDQPKGGLVPVCGNFDAILRKVEAESGIQLSQQQKQAVKKSLENGISIITGGPGTGKTTIMKALIAIMEEAGMKVQVAAPTGRAAKRIGETTGHYAQTVHRMLESYFDEGRGTMSFGRNASEPLNCQAVIVDEASMLDLILTEALCDALVPGTRLFFVGDADQLPPVGAGSVLADIIDSELFCISRLTEIYRQQEESNIVANAHRVNRGDYPVYGEDFLLIPEKKQDAILKKIIEECQKIKIDEVQVLTPTKKNILGSENLNQQLQDAFNPHNEGTPEIVFGKRVFRKGDRVMQTKNDYRLEWRYLSNSVPSEFKEDSIHMKENANLQVETRDGEKNYDGKGVFNGEIGRVIGIDMEMHSVAVVFDEERYVQYSYHQLDEIELAYAVTVHKSQGSEYSTVMIPMSWFPPALATRSLIYTAMTRGKDRVMVVGDPAYLNAMVDNNQGRRRNSGLRYRLEGIYRGLI